MIPKTVLVVDDEPDVAAFFAEAADLAGLRASVETDATTALELMRNIMPDVVVLDLFLPGVDGLQFIRHLSLIPNHNCALVLVSGRDESVLRAAKDVAVERGLQVIDVFTKPVHLDPLIACLQRARKTALSPRELPSDERIRQELPSAITNGEVIPYMEPQVELSTGKVVGVEALARWHHPELGVIPPNHFIKFAENNGLIGPVTDAVRNFTARVGRSWIESGLCDTLSINISATYMSELDVPERMDDMVRAVGLSPSSVLLELTETPVMHDLANALEVLTRLRLRGGGLSIDDFGTGYSSRAQLHRIPFAELKIDLGFVTAATEDREARAIVETTIMLAKKLGMISIAEGVETLDHYNLVRKLGCDRTQGYYIARPLLADAFPQWHEEWGNRIPN
jgi:EAL domain-containing protein (putative c-di-GMP-specific phosphodiesterase class I)/CheY-like chemotaxis protein